MVIVCFGNTIPILQNVTSANGTVMNTPPADSFELSKPEDNVLSKHCPSDTRDVVINLTIVKKEIQ